MLQRINRSFNATCLALLLGLALPSLLFAGAKIKVGDSKWFSIGMGFRSSFAVTENGAPNGTSDSAGVSFDNIRLYTAAKVHERVTVEFNTERSSGAGSTAADNKIQVLDAVAKFSMNGFDLWAGRFLPPSDRANLDGPFYLNAAYDFPIAQAYPAINAGRDNGIAIMKEYDGGKFKWSYGAFEGRTNSTDSSDNPDQTDNFLHAARATYNFWAPEPGFYTGSTYFGAKDVLAVGFVYQFEENGAGTSTTTAGDFTGWNVDVLMEKKLATGAVVNLEGAYYVYDTDDIADSTLTQGESYFVLASYICPDKHGWGQFQPYVRYQHFAKNGGNTGGGNTTRVEGGLNYILDGYNAKITALYYSAKAGTGASATDTFKLAWQFQL